MSKKVFLPESMYTVDSKMNYEKIISIYNSKDQITGRVIRLDVVLNRLEVDLGGGIIGLLPIEASTIYPIYDEFEKISYNVISLVGKNIQAQITDCDSNTVILSRKENMLEALEFFKTQTEVKFASITGFSKISAFIDIGAGITGRSYSFNFSTAIFEDIKDVGFYKNDIITVKILSFVEEKNCFELSRVEPLPNSMDILNKNDFVLCTVFGTLNDGEGYYVLYNNDFCGIVDSPKLKLEYGDEIVGVIKALTPKGARLNLVEKL